MSGEDHGFITLSRKFFDHALWKEPREFSRAEAWLDMIRMAAWSQHERIVNGCTMVIGRGEFLASLRFLAERWTWSIKRARGFVALLIESGQLAVREGTKEGHIYTLPNYETYNPKGHAQGTPRARSGHAQGTQAGHKEKAVQLEEQGEQELPFAPRPADAPPEKVMEFPVVGNPEEKIWHLTATKLAQYEAAFPAMDVRAELRIALQWLYDNPEQTKTATGMPRFLGYWLNNAQNKGRFVPRNGGSGPRPTRPPTGTAAERASGMTPTRAAQLDAVQERNRVR